MSNFFSKYYARLTAKNDSVSIGDATTGTSLIVNSDGSINVDVQGTVPVTLAYDTNYGLVGANTLRTAAQIGNATGAAAFNAGTTTAQVLRVVLPTDQTAIPATQSGAWTTGRTWNLLNTTDSVNAVQSGSWTALVNQGTSPWVVSGTVAATQSGTWTTGRTWSLLNSTDSITAFQGDTWSVGRTWTLLNSTDSVNAVQSGSWTTGRTWALSSGTDSVTVTGSVTTSPNVNVHDGAGNSIGSTSGSLNVDVTNTVPVSQSGTWNIATVTAVTSITNPVAVTQSTSPWVISGTVTANQGTSPWVTSVSNFPATVAVTQSTSPWVVSGTVTANAGTGTFAVSDATTHTTLTTINTTLGSPFQAGGSIGNTSFIATQTTGANLHVNVDNFPATVAVTQSTSPWVVSGTVSATQGTSPWVTSRNWTLSNSTDSVAAVQSGTWTVQQGTPPWSVSQSGTWTTGRTWTLASGTDSVAAVQSGTWNIGTVTTITNPVAVTQSTSPWVTNLTQFGGTNISTGTGASGAGIPRVTIANDSSLAAHQSVNMDQVGGGAVDLGQENAANSIPVVFSTDQSTASNNSYRHISGAAITVVKSGAGRLHAVLLNATGNSTTVTVYDNTAGSGTIIAVLGTNPGCFTYDVAFTTGLTLVTTNAATDVTVSYQ